MPGKVAIATVERGDRSTVFLLIPCRTVADIATYGTFFGGTGRIIRRFSLILARIKYTVP